MEEDKQNEYNPDYVSAPGSTIWETMKSKKIPIPTLMKELNLSVTDFCNLMMGEHIITSSLAKKLETALGIDAQFWINREALYREKLKEIETKSL